MILTSSDSLKNYSGDLLDIDKENKKLENIDNELNSLYKKEIDEGLFFRKNLLSLAKKSDVLKNENAKKIYIDSNEKIISTRIKYFLKLKKNLYYTMALLIKYIILFNNKFFI